MLIKNVSEILVRYSIYCCLSLRLSFSIHRCTHILDLEILEFYCALWCNENTIRLIQRKSTNSRKEANYCYCCGI
ncbi:Integrator complex subunit [Dirofilaria immitis]